MKSHFLEEEEDEEEVAEERTAVVEGEGEGEGEQQPTEKEVESKQTQSSRVRQSYVESDSESEEDANGQAKIVSARHRNEEGEGEKDGSSALPVLNSLDDDSDDGNDDEDSSDEEYQGGVAKSKGASSSDAESGQDGMDEDYSSTRKRRRRPAQKKKLQRGKKKAVIENDEDEERDEEKDAARGGSKTRSKRKERMLDSTKMKEPTGKKRRKKTDEDHEAFFSEMRGIAKNLVSRMHQAAEKDRSNFRKETPSFEKMLLLEEVEAIAKKERMYGILVEAGLIKAFADWLKPLDLDGDGKELPSVDTRDRILALLQWIPMAGELEGHGNLDEDDLEMFEGISLNTLVESEIGKVLVHLLNSPEETRENKRIITRVLQRIAAVVAEEEGVEDAFPQGNEMPESIQRKAESEMAKESAKPLIPRTLPSKVRGRIGTELDLDTLAQIRHVYPTEETFAFKHRPEKSATMEKMEKEFLMKKYRPSVAPTRRTKKGGGSGSASSRRRR